MIKIKVLKEREKLVGGQGDNKPDSDFNPEELAKGASDEEGEHTPDKDIAKEIAKDHLSKDPDYYKKAEKAGLGERKSRKLSSYWKKRAKRRALKAERQWPNNVDYKWALLEQEKSSKMNKSINALFEKELEMSEELSGSIEELLKKMKKMREQMRIQKFGPGTPNKSKKSLSKPYPKHKKGETVGGYYRKAAKKLGGIAAAPGETIGPGIGVAEE
jgi:hypothetical protein